MAKSWKWGKVAKSGENWLKVAKSWKKWEKLKKWGKVAKYFHKKAGGGHFG